MGYVQPVNSGSYAPATSLVEFLISSEVILLTALALSKGPTL